MRFLSKTILASVVTMAATGIAFSASAITWDLPAPLGEGNMHTIYLRHFAERLDHYSGGEFTLKVHASQSLIKEKETLKAVRNGQVPIGQFFLYRMGNDHPIYNTSQIPFIAGKADTAWKIWMLSEPKTQELLAKQNAKILVAVTWPETGFYTKEPITSLDQFKGVKFRTFSPYSSRLAELMGSDPVQIQVSEIAQAFATNLVQVMYTSAQTGVDSQAWDFAKYYTHARGGNRSMTLTVVNQKSYDKLSDKMKTALMMAAKDAQTYGWILCDSLNANLMDTLKENGMIIQDPIPELDKKIVEVGNTMLKEWADGAGEDGAAILKAYQNQ